MSSILYEVAAETVSYTVKKNIQEIYGTGTRSFAFKACQKDIKHIYFETGSKLKKIDPYSFYDCEYLVTIELEKCEYLETISHHAFQYCSELVNLTLPESLKTIESNAFERCYKIYNLVIPSSVTTLGECSFHYCSSAISIEINGKVKIIPEGCFKLCNKAKSLKLPDTLETIEREGFYCCYNIESVKMPSKMKTIGYSSFEECKSLKTSVLNLGLVTIDIQSFRLCLCLTEIVIPSSVENINFEAFYKCTSLSKITFESGIKIKTLNKWIIYETNVSTIKIPASITDIESEALELTYNLEYIEVEDGNLEYRANDGVLFTINNKTLVYYPNKKGTEYVIPNGTEIVNEDSFAYTSIKKVVFPPTLTDIKSSAFNHCSNMTTLDLNEVDGTYYVSNSCFESCISLKELHVSKSVRSLSYNVFRNCKNLVNITFDEGITIVSDECFANCISLEYIKLPNSVKDCGENLFEGCIKLHSIEFSSKMYYLNDYMFKNTNFTEIVIPEGITTISSFCFQDCKNLKKVVLPASCTKLGASIFSNCPEDINITFVEGSQFKIIKGFLIVNLNETIAYQYLKTSAYNFSIPSTIEEIKSKAFYDFKNLDTITFENNISALKIIGEKVFMSCTKLKEFGLCSNLKYIGKYAFHDTALEVLNFCPNIKIIDEKAFSYCSGLTTISDMNSLTKIYSKGFYCCSKIKEVGSMDNITEIGYEAFYECNDLEVFPFCPCLEYLKGYAFYSCNIKEFTFGGKIKTISCEVFYSCKNLEKITLLEANGSALTIDNRAFINCYSLKTFNMNKNVGLETIGSMAFASSGLTSFYFPSSLKTIDSKAFWNCSFVSFDSAQPGNLLNISESCFENCRNLESAILPNSVTEIGSFAFSNTNLKIFTVPTGTKTFVDRVFENSTNLKEFIIPDGSQLESMGYKLFSLCKSLSIITNNSPKFDIYQDGLFNKNMTRLYAFPPASDITDFNMPDTIKWIHPSAFYSCNNLITVSFPKDSIEEIGFSAFESCLNLKMLKIPCSLRDVGSAAFLNCPRLSCGQMIEKRTEEIIRLLVDIGGMSEYAVNPCPETHNNKIIFRPLFYMTIIFINS